MARAVPREAAHRPSVESLVEVARDGRVATVTLHRPSKLNAINDELLSQLHDSVVALARDDGVEVVVLAGTGRAFCAGFDISGSHPPQTSSDNEEYWRSHFARATDTLCSIWDLPQPVIAKLHGACLGGGLHLALCCDLRVAADDSVLGEPEVGFGGVPSFPFLMAMVSFCQASELLLTGARVDARRAYEIGLVNRVVPADQLDAEVAALAGRMARFPVGTLRRAKRITHKGFELTGTRELVEFAAAQAADALSHRSGEAAEFDAIAAESGVPVALEWLRGRLSGDERT